VKVRSGQVSTSQDMSGNVQVMCRPGQVRPGQVMVRSIQVRSDNDKVWSDQDGSRQLSKISDQVRSYHDRLVNAISGQVTVRSDQVK